MDAVKTRTLVVQIAATLEVDYTAAELEEMGKSFREFKLGVERVVRDDLLPAFSQDPHCRVKLGTVSFPALKTMKLKRKET